MACNGTRCWGLREPSQVLDLGNAGTGVRLLMGLVASHPFNSVFCGDASLSARPMERVMAPLRRMGVNFTARSGGLLPLTVHGSDMLVPLEETPVCGVRPSEIGDPPAGLNTRGKTTVIEPAPSRDHTENMLAHFGGSDRPGYGGWPGYYANWVSGTTGQRHSGSS